MAIVLANPGGPIANLPSVFVKRGLKRFVPLAKREQSRWGPIPKRRRWGHSDDQKSLSEDMKHLAEVAGTMNENESQVYFLKLKLADNARKRHDLLAALETNPDELSPSPPPQYDSQGKRLNTKEVRFKAKLDKERNDLFTQIVGLDKDFKIPAHWKQPIYRKKVIFPIEKHPEINFFGVIVGPRGMTQKRLSKETGCNIFIRGRGSFNSAKVARQPQEDDNDPMYVAISGPSQAHVDKAYKMCMDLLKESSSGESAKNKQLAELRSVLGWGGTVQKRCRICGGTGHPIWKCPDRPGSEWAPAEVQCSLCGEVSHITSDCKLYDKNAPEAQKKTMTLNEEYSKFLGELAGDGNMKTTAAGAITGTRATTAEMRKLRCRKTPEKSNIHRGAGFRGKSRGRGSYSGTTSRFGSRGRGESNLSRPMPLMAPMAHPVQTFGIHGMQPSYMVTPGYQYQVPQFNPMHLPDTIEPQLMQMAPQGAYVQPLRSYPPPQYQTFAQPPLQSTDY